ncbi:hypothetical protein AB0469_29115 [Streptomyces sp. NPDC093801]|uniref:hypothetical protein n=1 Tax=Streptomyces sp. NPDC093801 TaxID=3155203 RepID=UPI00344F59F6
MTSYNAFADDQRLVIFQDGRDDVAVGSGTLMNTWSHAAENKYGYGTGNAPSPCAVRDPSRPLTTSTAKAGKVTRPPARRTDGRQRRDG